jgi:hypothetical protein
MPHKTCLAFFFLWNFEMWTIEIYLWRKVICLFCLSCWDLPIHGVVLMAPLESRQWIRVLLLRITCEQQRANTENSFMRWPKSSNTRINLTPCLHNFAWNFYQSVETLNPCLLNNWIMDHLFIIAMFEDPIPNQQPMMCRYEHEL